ncbi:MAG: exopolyphosphatase [Holophaga sp.]|nr:exopolyphosphatase [Holophaga sp.]
MRLITRSDFDGLACAALLEELGLVDDYLFAHPKDIQDGKVPVTAQDILANVPFAPGCGIWFDHHSSEEERVSQDDRMKVEGASYRAMSCARVIYDYYGGAAKLGRFEESGLMEAVDRSDSGSLTEDEIKNPTGWILLSFIMDARTGLGRYRDYRISNLALMKDMIGYCRTKSIDEIIALPDVQERVNRYFEQEHDYQAMLLAHSKVDGKVLIIDLREVPENLSGNRFIEYALFPATNVSVRVIWGRERQNMVLTVGHSILDRSCGVNIGSLMLKYGGGGHQQVGTCQVAAALADTTLAEVIAALKA